MHGTLLAYETSRKNYAIYALFYCKLIVYKIGMAKTRMQEEIVKKSSEAINLAINRSSLKVWEVALKAKIAIGYLNELKAGKKRLNIVHIVTIAKALDKYPSELLPDEWQKPSSSSIEEIDIDIFEKAMNDILVQSVTTPLTSREKAVLILALYKRYIEISKNNKEESRNIS